MYMLQHVNRRHGTPPSCTSFECPVAPLLDLAEFAALSRRIVATAVFFVEQPLGNSRPFSVVKGRFPLAQLGTSFDPSLSLRPAFVFFSMVCVQTRPPQGGNHQACILQSRPLPPATIFAAN